MNIEIGVEDGRIIEEMCIDIHLIIRYKIQEHLEYSVPVRGESTEDWNVG